MEWGITFLDELQKMKSRMDGVLGDLPEEEPAKRRELGIWVERLPGFKGPRRRCFKSRSNEAISPP